MQKLPFSIFILSSLASSPCDSSVSICVWGEHLHAGLVTQCADPAQNENVGPHPGQMKSVSPSMGQSSQSTVEGHPPQGFTDFALDALVPGLVVRFRETPTATPAHHIMELPAWGRDGGYLTLLRYHGAYTQLKPSPHLYLGPLWGLRVTMQCQHPSISTMWPSHYPSAEGGSSLGASKRRDTRWGRAQGAGSMPLRSHPRGM